MEPQIVTTNNDFIDTYVTDSIYLKVIRELRTDSAGIAKKNIGRKRELTRELFRNYLHILSMTGQYELASISAGLPEKRRQKYMNESETFRGVSSLAKENISMRARMSVAQAIIGRKPSYYKLIHPETKKNIYVELKEIQPNVQIATWWLEKVEKIGQVIEVKNEHILGAPRNEEEARLLEMLLNRHSDYIKNKK